MSERGRKWKFTKADKNHNQKKKNINMNNIKETNKNIVKLKCPLHGSCREKTILYKAKVLTKESPEEERIYFGQIGNNLKIDMQTICCDSNLEAIKLTEFCQNIHRN